MREYERIDILIAKEDLPKLMKAVNKSVITAKTNPGAEMRKVLFDHFGVESTFSYPDRNFSKMCM